MGLELGVDDWDLPVDRRPDRCVARLLGCLCEDPGIYRYSGWHVDVPWCFVGDGARGSDWSLPGAVREDEHGLYPGFLQRPRFPSHNHFDRCDYFDPVNLV